jgi:hypothetical protein
MEEDLGETTETCLATRVPGVAPDNFPTDYNPLVQDCTSPQCGLPNLAGELGSFQRRLIKSCWKTSQFWWKGLANSMVASVLLNFWGMDRQGF